MTREEAIKKLESLKISLPAAKDEISDIIKLIESPWISVEEDLPCNNPNNIHFGFTNKVFAIDYNKNIFIAYMTKYNNKWIWCRDDNFNLSYIITHWMPIPEPPKE